MISLTEKLDKKINYCYQQVRGWQDVGHNYTIAERWWRVYKWFEYKREERLKAIFGS